MKKKILSVREPSNPNEAEQARQAKKFNKELLKTVIGMGLNMVGSTMNGMFAKYGIASNNPKIIVTRIIAFTLMFIGINTFINSINNLHNLYNEKGNNENKFPDAAFEEPTKTDDDVERIK